MEKEQKYRQNVLITGIAVAFALFFLYTAYFGTFPASIQRSVHLVFAIVLGFLLYTPWPGKDKKLFYTIIDMFLALVALLVFGYFVWNQEILTNWIIFVTSFGPQDFIISIIATLLLLEVGRRATGYALPIVGIIFLLYGRYGNILPGLLYHGGLSWEKLMEVLYYGFDGVFGIPIGVSATFIIIFIIFGCFFEKAGGGESLMDIGKYLTGRTRGGPAKIAVVASALFGTISGSAVANVYATGTFSIPMMKKLGFKPRFAGAVEACASTGGQIAPPVMGAAAFVMAEFTGFPYARIAAAALIPAILYYFSLFLSVDLEAGMTGIRGLSKDEIPKRKEVIAQLPILLTIVVLIVMLTIGYSAMLAGGCSILAIVLISWFNKKNRMTPGRILEALEMSGRRTVLIAASCGIAGIIIGVVSYTGLGINFIGMVLGLPGNISWMAPILIAMMSIVMGMCVPTTVAYIIVAAVAVPALRKLGFAILPSHMFAFYFAVISMITPPVAPASLAASEIAGDTFFRTGLTACKLGIVTFIVPFMFLYSPELLLQGSAASVLLASITSVIGVIALTAGLKGWFGIYFKSLERIAMVLGGLLLIKPGFITDAVGLCLVLIPVITFYKRKAALKNNTLSGRYDESS